MPKRKPAARKVGRPSGSTVELSELRRGYKLWGTYEGAGVEAGCSRETARKHLQADGHEPGSREGRPQRPRLEDLHWGVRRDMRTALRKGKSIAAVAKIGNVSRHQVARLRRQMAEAAA